jgi:hypothetical protein
MKKPGTLSTAARLSWCFHPEPLSRLQTTKDATLVKPILQDNIPRKTKFTFEEAVDVWLRRWSGQYQHQIAAAYVINVRAVNYVLKEKTHVGSKQVAETRFNKSA